MAHIVLIIRRYADGSAAMNRLIAYAKGFADAGNRVTLLFLITRDRRKCFIDHPKINIIHLWETDGALCRRYTMLSYIRNLMRITKYISIGDSIMLYGFELPISLGVSLLCKRVNVFYETTEHPFYKGESFVKKVILLIRVFFIKRANGLFVISESLKSYYIGMGVSPNKILVVNMFVDESRFTGLRKTSNEDYVAYCGIVSKRKDGVDDLLKAFALFHQVYPNYKLYIIGKSTSEAEYNSLIELACDLHIEKHVVFTGQVQSDHMPQLLFNAKILALARPNNLQAQNGFPTKLGEYLATGNPVAVTNVGEIGLFVKDKVNGFVSEPNDFEAFATNLIYIADNYSRALEIGNKGRLLVTKEFSSIYQSKLASEYINNCQ